MDEYLEHLDDDGHLLNICEIPDDKDIQLFLISYVELNIDINSQEADYLSLLRSFRDHELEALAQHLNIFVKKLTDSDIEHQLSEFTPDTLPSINLSY